MVTSRVIQKGRANLLEINGKPMIPYGYMSYQPEKADYAGFADAGVRLFFLPVYAGDRGINPESGTKPFYDGFWKGPDEYDFSAADRLYRIAVGDRMPGEIYVIPRVMLEPPSFWEKAHPEELARDFAGASVHQSYSSKVWMKDTVKAMEAFGRWLTESGWDEYTAGWQIAAGHTEEFMRPITHALQMTDYSQTALAAWREFLKRKYETPDHLSAAWGTRVSSFEEAEAPAPARRLYTENGSGIRNAQAADYYRFHSEETARAICDLAREAKRVTGGKRVIGAFYGYCGAERGHTALDIVLASKDVDFLASPYSYKFGRPENADWAIGGPIDSCALNGKLWFMECDVRTHLSRSLAESMPRAMPAGGTYYSGSVWFGPATEKAALNQLKKAFAKTLSHGAAMWWFDMWGGWFKTDAYMAFQRSAKRIYERVMLENDFEIAAKTAIVCDLTADEIRTNAPDRTDALWMLSRTGAPFRQYELSDIGKIPAEEYRALILVNVYRLSDAQKALLRNWMKDGRSIVSISSPAEIGDAEGFTQEIPGGRVLVTDEYQHYGFDALPEYETVREALLLAGVHIYNFTGEAIYASGGMVAIHAASAGSKRIYLPRKGRLQDAFTREILENCDHFTDFVMEEGETRVFYTVLESSLS